MANQDTDLPARLLKLGLALDGVAPPPGTDAARQHAAVACQLTAVAKTFGLEGTICA